LELLNRDKEKLADLPVIELVDADGERSFSGNLDPGSQILIRIEFRGPVDPETFLRRTSGDSDGFGSSNGDYHGILKIHFGSSSHPTIILVGPGLYPIAQIAT
jgi:hypothetical protein